MGVLRTGKEGDMTAWEIGAAVSGPRGGRLNQPEGAGANSANGKLGKKNTVNVKMEPAPDLPPG